jgi:mono/diheme cytochrome c family protein
MHLFVRTCARILSPQSSRSAIAVVVALISLSGTARAQDAAPPRPAGIYTEEQAERGNGIFTKTCVECHTRKDMSGADFRLNWNGRTVFELFERIRTTMPDAAPGSMTREEYADVTTYLLKLNGMPSGSTVMPGDSTINATKIDIPAPPGTSLVSRGGMLMRLPTPVRAAMLGHGQPTRAMKSGLVRAPSIAAHSTPSR